MHQEVETLFDLTGRVAVITGGSGLLGYKHAEVIAAAGGLPVLADLPAAEPEAKAEELRMAYGVQALGCATDITKGDHVKALLATVLDQFGTVDILINNAANNPKVEGSSDAAWSRLENLPLDVWEADLAVGLTGAFLCSQVIG